MNAFSGETPTTSKGIKPGCFWGNWVCDVCSGGWLCWFFFRIVVVSSSCRLAKKRESSQYLGLPIGREEEELKIPRVANRLKRERAESTPSCQLAKREGRGGRAQNISSCKLAKRWRAKNTSSCRLAERRKSWKVPRVAKWLKRWRAKSTSSCRLSKKRESWKYLELPIG